MNLCFGFWFLKSLQVFLEVCQTEEHGVRRCRANMPDRWSDDLATPEDMAGKSWASLARFLGGVCRSLGQGGWVGKGRQLACRAQCGSFM